MTCPLKSASSIGENLCDKENCGFYSCENQKCAVALLSNIASEIAELKSVLNHTAETLNDTNTRLTYVAAVCIK